MGETDAMDASKLGVETAGHKAALSPVVENLTRLGYGARGLIYCTMGVLALQMAAGSGGSPADQQGAIAAIGRQPAGRILLMVVLAGLVCYSFWGVFRAVFDRHHQGHGWKGVLERLGYLFSAAAYASLVLPTYGLITGGAQPAQGGVQSTQAQHSVASVMSLPLGKWLVGALGFVVIAVGVYQVYQGIRVTFDRLIQSSALTPRQLKWIKGMGRFGTVARGIVFALTGILIVLSAYHSDPRHAEGIDSALIALLRQPFGPWLLGLVAIGLLSFGLYSMMSALWFRFKT
jgi:hypothetical protein